MNFERPSKFSQAKIVDLSASNSVLQTKMEAMEKTKSTTILNRENTI